MTARDIDAKRSRYGGKLMRSQLEVSWARMFDARGIDWLYEPENLRAPNGWLPDFALRAGDGDEVLLVEVKPTIEIAMREHDWLRSAVPMILCVGNGVVHHSTRPLEYTLAQQLVIGKLVPAARFGEPEIDWEAERPISTQTWVTVAKATIHPRGYLGG